MSNTQQYREVQRKANAGERIKIVKAELAFGKYRNRDEFIADEITRLGVNVPEVSAECNSAGFISDREYVVLEPIAPNLPDLFAQFIRDNAPAVRSYLAELDPVNSAEVNEPASPTLTRAKVIEMARERVAELERIGGDRNATLEGSDEFGSHFYSLEFVVNREKRVVTALVFNTNHRGRRLTRKPDAVGIAKCAPDDVFNADIGKAIAAERALGLTLTDAFVNAPKPEKPLAGMYFKPYARHAQWTAKLTERWPLHDGSRGYGKAWKHDRDYGWVGERQFRIIDDTDADYAQKAGEAA
nr:hypothetical protein [Paenibacillus xylanexedens]